MIRVVHSLTWGIKTNKCCTYEVKHDINVSLFTFCSEFVIYPSAFKSLQIPLYVDGVVSLEQQVVTSVATSCFINDRIEWVRQAIINGFNNEFNERDVYINRLALPTKATSASLIIKPISDGKKDTLNDTRIRIIVTIAFCCQSVLFVLRRTCSVLAGVSVG